MIKQVSLLACILFISACASTPVPEADGVKSVSAVGASCKKPYVLTQDCSIWSGAKKAIKVNGFAMKAAGSADGKTILLMDKSPNMNALKSGLTLNIKDYNEEANNNGFYAVRKMLHDNDITITEVIPMASLGTLFGYYIVTDKAAYSLLTQ